jgi:hypothetical protein
MTMTTLTPTPETMMTERARITELEHRIGQAAMEAGSWRMMPGWMPCAEAGERILSALEVPVAEWPRSPQDDSAAPGTQAPALASPEPAAAATDAPEGLSPATSLPEDAGYSIIRTDELERFQEIAAQADGRFTAKEVIKPGRDADFYVGWSHVVEAPVWAGTREQALADGCPPSRLRRADENGTSIRDGFGLAWDGRGLIAEQRGFLPRTRLAAYVAAYMEGRMDDAWDLLEPFDGETEVRRDRRS